MSLFCTLHFACLLTPIFLGSIWYSWCNDDDKLTWNIIYPESYIQKSSGAFPALLSCMARHCCKMRRHRCGPLDFVLIICLLFGFWVARTSYFNPHTHKNSKKKFFSQIKKIVSLNFNVNVASSAAVCFYFENKFHKICCASIFVYLRKREKSKI